MKASEYIETERLILRRPSPADAEIIFARYANDPDVTRYLGWPCHKSIEQTRSFLSFSDTACRHAPKTDPRNSLPCLVFEQGKPGVINVGMLAKIRRMHIRERLSVREIARRTGLSRNTIILRQFSNVLA